MCTAGNAVEALGVVGGAAIAIGSGGTLAGVGLGVASAGIAAGGAIDAGKANADAQDRQAKVDDVNAKIADDQAGFAVRDAEVKAGRIATQTTHTQAAQRLAAASANLDVASGSAADATLDSAAIGAHMESIAKLEGARLAYGYKSQGLGFEMSAAAKRSSADDYLTGSYISAAGRLLGGAATAYAGYQAARPKAP